METCKACKQPLKANGEPHKVSDCAAMLHRALDRAKGEVEMVRSLLHRAEMEEADAKLQLQRANEAAARWVEYVFEKNTEERFRTAHLRGFVMGLAGAYREGLHLKRLEKLEPRCPYNHEDHTKTGFLPPQNCPNCAGKPNCLSTYTHSTLGRLACQKDEGHLGRIGDVEHQRGDVKWMSV